MHPLVSCIMPTYNRRQFVPLAIRYFLQQDYPNKELIIIDDGNDDIRDLIPEHPAIFYTYLNEKITLGAKLNMACQAARGDIVVHWDDDDWYAPRRLQYQINSLLDAGVDVCGINHLLYYDLHTKEAFQYVYPGEQPLWLLGSSLCYKKEAWKHNRFADIDVGMDGLFIWGIEPQKIKVLPDFSFAVHMIHGHNVSPKKTNGIWWSSYPAEQIKEIMQTDWDSYQQPDTASARQLLSSPEKGSVHISAPQKFQNIFACLVHEKEDCIIDLVQNLHHHDPSSLILLYNGSDNPQLIPSDFSYKQYNAFVVPKPVAVNYGRLHTFAVHCMQFALRHFSFDAITIVDSDQLAVRSGYTEYLSAFLAARPNAGMLSSQPEPVTQQDFTTNYTALQALKEYELWKPFLDRFPGGKNKFVHWTFWPATVFIYKAVRDLVKVFADDQQLQNIIEQSAMWATEEVILPTLVRLLGYDITANPCSYEFVQYRKHHTINDVYSAVSKRNVFWLHPVERNINNPVRAYIRRRCNNYKTEATESFKRTSTYITHTILLNKLSKIDGWLTNGEAEVLITIAKKVCQKAVPDQNIVEIGSYHGKATVLFGSIIKETDARIKVYAIDSHNGRLGSVDKGLRSFHPSLQKFRENIEENKLTGVVETIINKPYNVKWNLPVSLLFIDGLHDYLNVSKDFRHFSNWVVPNGYVAFHDYHPDFPGVETFVTELLQTGQYQKIYKTGSLIVLKKRCN